MVKVGGLCFEGSELGTRHLYSFTTTTTCDNVIEPQGPEKFKKYLGFGVYIDGVATPNIVKLQ